MKFSFCLFYSHGMCFLRTYSMIIILRMDRRRDFVGHDSHFLHNVYFTTHGPWISIPVIINWHHPKSRPRPLAFRQHDTCFKIAIFPTSIHFSIHTTRVNFTIGAFETINIQLTVHKFCHTLSVSRTIDVILKFIIYPPCSLNLVCPIIAKRCTLIKFIMPNQPIPLRSIDIQIFSRFLNNCYRYFLCTSHNLNCTRTGNLCIIS